LSGVGSGFTNLGRVSYNVSDWAEFQSYSFTTGVNVKSAPQELLDTDLTVGLNVYLRSDGGVEQRKGYTQRNPTPFANAFLGVARFNQTIVNATPVSPSTKFLLGQNGTSLVDIDRGTVIQTNAFAGGSKKWKYDFIYDGDHLVTAYKPPTVTANATAGTFGAGVYLVTYAFGLATGGNTAASAETSYSATTANQSINVVLPTIPTGVNTVHVYTTVAGGASGTELAYTTAFPVISGTTPTLVVSAPGSGVAQPTVGTNNLAGSDVMIITTGVGGPYIFDGYSVYVPPAYVAGGISGASWIEVINDVVWFGGIPSQTNLVAGTAIGYPEGNNNASIDLQPVGLPSYAQFAMSSPVTGLSVLGAGPQAGLVVGLNKGLTVLFGTAPGNYFAQDVPSEDGVASGYCMASYSGIVYFMGRQAFYMYDGSSNPQQLSQNIEPWILNDALNQDYSLKGDRTTTFVMEYNNRLHIWYDVVGSGQLTNVLVFDLNNYGWTVLTLANPMIDACVLNGPGDAVPSLPVCVDQNVGLCYNWDAYSVTQPNGQTHAVSDNGTAISAQMATKFFKIGVPGTPKRLMRLYPELFVEQFSGQVQATTDYGYTTSGQEISLTPPPMALWDVALWDQFTWAQTAVRTFLGAPSTRFDLNLTGEAFSFGLQTNSTNPPWTLQGFTGTYRQESRV
jgi:hypothetical protein